MINLVYVHLGKNPSPTLIPYAELHSKLDARFQLILVTDNPSAWTNFPGKVIKNMESQNYYNFKRALETRDELNRISNGYWANTVGRLFALSTLKGYIGPHEPIIHLESDVLITSDFATTAKILELIPSVAIPRYNDMEGIASVLMSRNLASLENCLIKLDSIYSDKKWRTDMKLLGEGFTHGFLSELPTEPSKAWELEINKTRINVIFDGAALGQYLFGQDALHTGGHSIGGFKNPNISLPWENIEWKIDHSSPIPKIRITVNGIDFEVYNLHLHAKPLFTSPEARIETWKAVVLAANGQTDPYVGPKVVDLIHSSDVSLRDRLARIAHKGIHNYINEKLRNLLRKKK